MEPLPCVEEGGPTRLSHRTGKLTCTDSCVPCWPWGSLLFSSEAEGLQGSVAQALISPGAGDQPEVRCACVTALRGTASDSGCVFSVKGKQQWDFQGHIRRQSLHFPFKTDKSEDLHVLVD